MPAPRRSLMTWLLIAAMGFAAAFTTFYVVRSVREFLFWQQHSDEPIQPWMSIGFVAHSYHVPPPVLHDAMGLPPRPDHRPLERIAASQGVAYTVLRDRLYRAIAQSRPPHPPPRPPVPGDGRRQ